MNVDFSKYPQGTKYVFHKRTPMGTYAAAVIDVPERRITLRFRSTSRKLRAFVALPRTVYTISATQTIVNTWESREFMRQGFVDRPIESLNDLLLFTQSNKNCDFALHKRRCCENETSVADFLAEERTFAEVCHENLRRISGLSHNEADSGPLFEKLELLAKNFVPGAAYRVLAEAEGIGVTTVLESLNELGFAPQDLVASA